MKYKYKLLAEEILEEYVNAYSKVDLERVAKKIEEVAKDTAKEILQTIKRAKESGQIYYNDAFIITAQKAYGVEVE